MPSLGSNTHPNGVPFCRQSKDDASISAPLPHSLSNLDQPLSKAHLNGPASPPLAAAQASPAEATLRLLAEQRRLALDAARVGWWQCDPGTGLFYVDERYADILGIDAQPQPLSELLKSVYPEDRQRVEAAMKAATRGQDTRPYDIEYRVVLPNGQLRWVVAKGQATFEVDGDSRQYASFVGTLCDITESRAVRDALHASELRFRQLADAMPAIVWMTDGDGMLEDHNCHWTAYIGASSSPSGARQRWFDAMHLDDSQTVYALWRTAVRDGEPFDYQSLVRCVTDGALRWHHHRATPYRNADGTIARWFGSSIDIHEFK
ncbi:MAG: sensor hybrid histidine kinase [Phycisphaerales bacterium]|nr:sensor hybrid histidine kinase [Phycisphaerales bacterium]